jgi:hypothetical protein
VRKVLILVHMVKDVLSYKATPYGREGVGRCILFTQRFRRKGYAHLLAYAWEDSKYDRPISIRYITPDDLSILLKQTTSDGFLACAASMSLRKQYEESK